MITIDGSYHEGGGQIVRTACALSAITKKPCRVFNIRKGREKPGLSTQHLLGIEALTQLCKGRLEGNYLGSQEINFYPGSGYREQFSVNISTAGSVTLVLQLLIPVLLFASKPTKIIFNGGATDTFFSPTIDYFRYCFLKILEKMLGPLPNGSGKAKVKINIIKRGYYPQGGTKVEVKVFPFFRQGSIVKTSKLKTLNLTKRGDLKKILVISGASEFLKDKKVAERQVAGTREILGKLQLPVEEKIEYYQTQCPGSQICLLAQFENTVLGTDNLGKLGKRAEDVGKEAALKLLKEQKTGACLDKHLADQILVFIALAGSMSEITVEKITNHCLTNMHVIEKFLPVKFKVESEKNKFGKISVKGIGL